jgi:hypothetical protein
MSPGHRCGGVACENAHVEEDKTVLIGRVDLPVFVLPYLRSMVPQQFSHEARPVRKTRYGAGRILEAIQISGPYTALTGLIRTEGLG